MMSTDSCHLHICAASLASGQACRVLCLHTWADSNSPKEYSEAAVQRDLKHWAVSLWNAERTSRAVQVLDGNRQWTSSFNREPPAPGPRVQGTLFCSSLHAAPFLSPSFRLHSSSLPGFVGVRTIDLVKGARSLLQRLSSNLSSLPCTKQHLQHTKSSSCLHEKDHRWAFKINEGEIGRYAWVICHLWVGYLVLIK